MLLAADDLKSGNASLCRRNKTNKQKKQNKEYTNK